MGDSNYSRITPTLIECSSRLRNRNNLDSSERMLSPQIFQKVCQIRVYPELDLFASSLSHQIATYVAWKPDPHSHKIDAFQQSPTPKFLYAYPPFCMISTVLNKALKDYVSKLILITPVWTTQVWYPKILSKSIKSPILLSRKKDFLKNPNREIHFLVQSRALPLLASTFSELDFRRREFQRQHVTLSPSQEDQIIMQIMNRPRERGIAGVLKGKLIIFLLM